MAHSSARSVYSARSVRVHGPESLGQFSKCGMVWVAFPHSHKVGPLWYPHLAISAFDLPTPVRSLFRHFHLSQDASAPAGRASAGHIFMLVVGGLVSRRSFHLWSLAAGFDESKGRVWLRKHFLDSSRRGAGSWPCIMRFSCDKGLEPLTDGLKVQCSTWNRPLSRKLLSRMDTIPNDNILHGHYPKWPISRMDTTLNEYYPTKGLCLFGIVSIRDNIDSG